jgi:hypothetical protein
MWSFDDQSCWTYVSLCPYSADLGVSSVTSVEHTVIPLESCCGLLISLRMLPTVLHPTNRVQTTSSSSILTLWSDVPSGNCWKFSLSCEEMLAGKADECSIHLSRNTVEFIFLVPTRDSSLERPGCKSLSFGCTCPTRWNRYLIHESFDVSERETVWLCKSLCWSRSCLSKCIVYLFPLLQLRTENEIHLHHHPVP